MSSTEKKKPEIIENDDTPRTRIVDGSADLELSGPTPPWHVRARIVLKAGFFLRIKMRFKRTWSKPEKPAPEAA